VRFMRRKPQAERLRLRAGPRRFRSIGPSSKAMNKTSLDSTPAPFSWPTYPKSEGEFVQMMQALDAALVHVPPPSRPLHLGLKLNEAFRWEGNVFPSHELTEREGFEGDVLMAKAQRWYRQTYGQRLSTAFDNASGPLSIGQAIWRVHVPRIYGNVQPFVDRDLSNEGTPIAPIHSRLPATFNALRMVDGLPQGMANQLTDEDLQHYMDFFVAMTSALTWRDRLTSQPLFLIARDDYAESTEAVISGRWIQACWAAAQAAEKTLKGLLTVAGIRNFPRSGKQGHDIALIAAHLKPLGIAVPSSITEDLEWSAQVRYGAPEPTQQEALKANHGVLRLLNFLRTTPGTDSLPLVAKR
jgi:HEPN domain-containing protein